MFRRIVESGILPEGALQLICGGVGDLFDHLTGQDVVSFTGSAATGATAARASQHRRQLRAFHDGGRQPQRLPARPRRRAGHRGVRSLRQGSRARNDGEGRAEMHGDPPRAGSPRPCRGGDRGAVEAARRRRRRRCRATRRRAWGRSPASRSARRCARASPNSRAEAEIVAGDPNQVKLAERRRRGRRVPQSCAALLRKARRGARGA